MRRPPHPPTPLAERAACSPPSTFPSSYPSSPPPPSPPGPPGCGDSHPPPPGLRVLLVDGLVPLTDDPPPPSPSPPPERLPERRPSLLPRWENASLALAMAHCSMRRSSMPPVSNPASSSSISSHAKPPHGAGDRHRGGKPTSPLAAAPLIDALSAATSVPSPVSSVSPVSPFPPGTVAAATAAAWAE